MAYARVGNFGRVLKPSVRRVPVPVWPRYRRGMGDVLCADMTTAPTLADCVGGGPGASNNPMAELPPAPVVYVPTGPGSGAASSSGSWDQFWQGLTANSLNIFGKVVAPPAYQQTTRDAYGNVISTTVAQGAAGAPGTVAALGGSISPNVLLLGGGAAALLILIMAMKK